jgi:hypothetical protein
MFAVKIKATGETIAICSLKSDAEALASKTKLDKIDYIIEEVKK